MSRARDVLVSAAVLVLGRRRRGPLLRPGERERIVPVAPASPGAELSVLLLLLAAAGCAVAFVVVYALDSLPNQTQLLGGSLGLSLVLVAAALVLTGKRLVAGEELEDEYPAEEHPDDQETVLQVVAESGDRLTRRRLLKLGAGAAGGSLALAFITPAVSLGPIFDTARFYGTPWRRGRRLVDESDKPYRAADIEENDFYTAFPEGADKEEIGASLVLVRLPRDGLALPAQDAGFDAGGILAFSKICTHAGCAISLYRAPLFPAAEPAPALVCPCHYSTFDPAAGGKVIFGPAGRKLPMLPIYVDPRGQLRARGNFDESVGPSWWGVRLKGPTP